MDPILALAIPAIGELSWDIQTLTPPFMIGAPGTQGKKLAEAPTEASPAALAYGMDKDDGKTIAAISPSTANCEAAIWSKSGSAT